MDVEAHMRFARYTFLAAGIYGMLVLVPQYFLESRIGDDNPPAITHPEYFYGFIGVAVAFQLVFADRDEPAEVPGDDRPLDRGEVQLRCCGGGFADAGAGPGTDSDRSGHRFTARRAVRRELVQPGRHKGIERTPYGTHNTSFA